MDSSKENIKQLLDKYWAGETSLTEESQLSSYFTSGKVDEEFKAYAPLFAFFAEERNLTIDIEDDIIAKIEAAKPEAKIISFNWRRAIAVAASLLLVISLGILTYRNQEHKKQVDLAQLDTFESPEQALEQTKAALQFLSTKMNKATDKAAKTISKTKSLDIIN
jgi:hypothetical protein